MPVLAASLPFLDEVVVLFALSALIAYLCTRIWLVPIAGFLLTGVAVGPYALGLVRDPELVSTLAEIGVILLLFEIGIEFSLAKLARLKRTIGLGGGLQVGGTVALVTGIGVWAGVDLGSSLYTGFLVALSSTSVVLGLLSSRGEEGGTLVLQGPDDEEMRTRSIRVPEGCSIVGRTLGDLQLPEAHDLMLLAVRRGDETLSNVSEDLRIEAGDRLVVLGRADDFVECADLFRVSERAEPRVFGG